MCQSRRPRFTSSRTSPEQFSCDLMLTARCSHPCPSAVLMLDTEVSWPGCFWPWDALGNRSHLARLGRVLKTQ